MCWSLSIEIFLRSLEVGRMFVSLPTSYGKSTIFDMQKRHPINQEQEQCVGVVASRVVPVLLNSETTWDSFKAWELDTFFESCLNVTRILSLCKKS